MNDVCPGSRPVGPAGRTTSIGETDPDLAAAGTLISRTAFLISERSLSVKRNPTFPFT